MIEQPLSEILAEAFQNAGRDVRPSPTSDEDRTAVDAMCLSARVLAASLASHFGIAYTETWDELCHVPDEMLRLLRTPYGWYVLGEHIAQDLGCVTAPTFIPTIH